MKLSDRTDLVKQLHCVQTDRRQVQNYLLPQRHSLLHTLPDTDISTQVTSRNTIKTESVNIHIRRVKPRKHREIDVCSTLHTIH